MFRWSLVEAVDLDLWGGRRPLSHWMHLVVFAFGYYHCFWYNSILVSYLLPLCWPHPTPPHFLPSPTIQQNKGKAWPTPTGFCWFSVSTATKNSSLSILWSLILGMRKENSSSPRVTCPPPLQLASGSPAFLVGLGREGASLLLSLRESWDSDDFHLAWPAFPPLGSTCSLHKAKERMEHLLSLS